MHTSRHKPGKPLSSTPAIFPTHNPLAHPTPVVNTTFSSLLHPSLKIALAFAYALSHAPEKSGTCPPRPGASFGGGGLDGSMEGNSGTPMGEEGVGKGVKEIGVIGTVMGPVYVL